MKKYLNNFKWTTFFAYATIFGGVSLLMDWGLGKFKDENFTTEKYVTGLAFKTIIFSLIMAFVTKPKERK